MRWNNSDVCKVQQPGIHLRYVLQYQSRMLSIRSRLPNFLEELPENQKRNRNQQDSTNRRIPRRQVVQKLFRVNPSPEIIFSNPVKTHLTQLDRNLRLVLNKIVNPTQIMRTQAWLKQAKVSQVLVDRRLNFTKTSGKKKTTHHFYIAKGKGKNKRILPFPPLTVGDVREKRPRK